MLGIAVLPADVQDRDAAPRFLKHTRSLFPWLELVFADGAYAGPKLAGALAGPDPIRIEIVKRSDRRPGFVVVARRWVIERTFSWLLRCRRLVRDHENLAAIAVAFIKLAMIALMLRRLATPRQSA